MGWLVALLPIVLIVGGCFLLMRFMMRGMHSGHDQDAEEKDHVHDAPVRDPKAR
jgi:hypothetical protein